MTEYKMRYVVVEVVQSVVVTSYFIFGSISPRQVSNVSNLPMGIEHIKQRSLQLRSQSANEILGKKY